MRAERWDVPYTPEQEAEARRYWTDVLGMAVPENCCNNSWEWFRAGFAIASRWAFEEAAKVADRRADKWESLADSIVDPQLADLKRSEAQLVAAEIRALAGGKGWENDKQQGRKEE